MRSSLLSAVALALLIGACGGGSPTPETSHERVGQPTGPNAALYFTIVSDEPDRLIGASTDVASTVHLHETVTDDSGTTGMRPIDGIDVPAGSEVVLEPGGFHLMLIDVERLEVGDMIDVVLNWENAGETTVEAEVVAPDETVIHEGHDG